MQSISSTIPIPCSQSLWCENMKKIIQWPIEIILVDLRSAQPQCLSQLIIFATIINSSKPKRLLEICDNLALNWGMEFKLNLLWTHPSSCHWLNQKAISNYIRFCCILDLILPSNNISGKDVKKYPRFKEVQAGWSAAVKWSVHCILDEVQPSNSMKMGLDMYIQI
jgi:hypothetical protein